MKSKALGLMSSWNGDDNEIMVLCHASRAGKRTRHRFLKCRPCRPYLDFPSSTRPKASTQSVIQFPLLSQCQVPQWAREVGLCVIVHEAATAAKTPN